MLRVSVCSLPPELCLMARIINQAGGHLSPPYGAVIADLPPVMITTKKHSCLRQSVWWVLPLLPSLRFPRVGCLRQVGLLFFYFCFFEFFGDISIRGIAPSRSRAIPRIKISQKMETKIKIKYGTMWLNTYCLHIAYLGGLVVWYTIYEVNDDHQYRRVCESSNRELALFLLHRCFEMRY